MNSVHSLSSLLTVTSLVRVTLKFSKNTLFSRLCVSPDTLKFRSDMYGIVCTHTHNVDSIHLPFCLIIYWLLDEICHKWLTGLESAYYDKYSVIA